MEVFAGHRALTRRLTAPAVAIGNFDGVHVGHQELLHSAVTCARARGGEATVLTFAPHPAKVLAPRLAPPLLTNPTRKLELLAARGIDVCVIEPFTLALAAMPAASFVHDLLVAGLGAKDVIVGWDFTYGQKRSGTVESLRADCTALGVAVHVVAPVAADGLVASSTKVRELLHEGNVAGARLLLGRDFDVDGTVVRGAGRGRTIGIPTANVQVCSEVLPRPGVYAARVLLHGDGGVWLPAILNLGQNPTFVVDGAISLEVHVLDWDGDLYDRTVRVAFVERLRDERRFAGPGELVAQIHADIAQARATFNLPERASAPR
jgi:riboflavin kinase/FMN adenylyltransferase